MKDRVSKHPGRVKLTPVDGQAYTYDMIRADEPEEAGTPINKNSLLKDETAKTLGLDPAASVPDDALKKIVERYDPKVGDILETVRDDLGAGWLACDGTLVTPEDHQKLYDELPYNTEWRRIMPSVTAGATGSTVDYYSVRPLAIPGKWAFVSAYPNGTTSLSNGRAAVYDVATDTLKEITCPQVSDAVKSYGIFGLTHNGDSYVLGVYEENNGTTTAGKVRLYTSTDLVTWRLGYTFSCATYVDLALDLSFDGTNILYYEYNNQSTGYANSDGIYSIDKAMTKKTRLLSPAQNFSNRFVVLPNGYWSYATHDSEGISVYAAGGTSSLFYFSTSSGTPRIAFFNDRYWVGLPNDSLSTSYIYAVDLTTNEVDRISLSNLVEVESGEKAYLQSATYDRNTREWTFYLFSQKTGTGNVGKKFYAAYISEDANPLDKTPYRVVTISTHAVDELSYEQMAPDRSQMRLSESSADQYLRDPNLKYLPSHEDGGIRRYIYEGVEGEQSGENPSQNLHATDPNAVHYYRDEKTEEQKAQARENIGAASKSMKDDTTATVYSIGIDNGLIYLEEV